MAKICTFPKSTHVRSYSRYRKGQWEVVCEHCRADWGSKLH